MILQKLYVVPGIELGDYTKDGTFHPVLSLVKEPLCQHRIAEPCSAFPKMRQDFAMLAGERRLAELLSLNSDSLELSLKLKVQEEPKRRGTS